MYRAKTQGRAHTQVRRYGGHCLLFLVLLIHSSSFPECKGTKNNGSELHKFVNKRGQISGQIRTKWQDYGVRNPYFCGKIRKRIKDRKGFNELKGFKAGSGKTNKQINNE
jgi:hypothetical protein